MRVIHIRERGGNELQDYKDAVKMAKKAIDTICELTEEMEDEFSERSERYENRYNERYPYASRNYGERNYGGRGYASHGGYYGREWQYMPDNREWVDGPMPERGYDRDSMGRFK